MTGLSTRSLLNVVLVAIVAGLVLLVVYEPGIEVPPEPERLTDLDSVAIRQLRMERPDQPEMRFEKRADTWYMLEPYQLPANNLRVGAVPDIVEAPSHAQLSVTELALDRFSLDPPNASLFLGDVRIDFGGSEQLSAMRYVRLGDTVHLITDRFYHHLLTAPAGLVDHRLLGPHAEPVEITLPEHRLTLADGIWTVAPELPEMTADAPVRLAEAWRHAQAIEVTALQNQDAEQRVSIRLKGQTQPLRYLVSTAEHGVIFARPDAGVQYHLTESSAEPLLRIGAPISGAEDGDGNGPPPTTPGQGSAAAPGN